MRSIVIVYFLLLCGSFNSATKILNIPQEISLSGRKMIQISKLNNKFIQIPEIDSSIFSQPQFIQKAGFPVETHTIQTEDGYLLTLYRIRDNNSSQPVLLQHGVLSSSADWIISGKDKGLAFILANEGYDVWLGNFRGNTYSRAHVFLSPTDSRFWNFSFHEMGIYDLPAMISYITNITSQPLHTYIGHSMGTTASYVMAVERPDIARKVRLIISLAPAVFLRYMKSPLMRFLALIAEDIKRLLHFLGTDEFLPHNNVTYFLKKLLCDKTPIQKEICVNLIFIISGFDWEQFNMNLIPLLLSTIPAGTSTKMMVHLAQLHIFDKFRQYDYGNARNLQIYNSPQPPDYNLSNVTTPFALFYGENDWLCSVSGVKKLIGLLPNVVAEYKVPFSKFTHFDFVWAIDAPQLVYKRLMEVMNMNPKSIE